MAQSLSSRDLISLPPEIRLQIYSHSLPDAILLDLTMYPQNGLQTRCRGRLFGLSDVDLSLEKAHLFDGLPLLRVCRQIYHEAAPLMWQSYHWTFNGNCDLEVARFALRFGHLVKRLGRRNVVFRAHKNQFEDFPWVVRMCPRDQGEEGDDMKSDALFRVSSGLVQFCELGK